MSPCPFPEQKKEKFLLSSPRSKVHCEYFCFELQKTAAGHNAKDDTSLYSDRLIFILSIAWLLKLLHYIASNTSCHYKVTCFFPIRFHQFKIGKASSPGTIKKDFKKPFLEYFQSNTPKKMDITF